MAVRHHPPNPTRSPLRQTQVQIDQSLCLAPSMLLGPAPSSILVATPDRGGNQPG